MKIRRYRLPSVGFTAAIDHELLTAQWRRLCVAVHSAFAIGVRVYPGYRFYAVDLGWLSASFGDACRAHDRAAPPAICSHRTILV